MFQSTQNVSWPKKDGSPSFLKHLGPFGCIETAILSENAKCCKSGFRQFFYSQTYTGKTVQKWSCFRIFHTPWYVQGVWKIVKSDIFLVQFCCVSLGTFEYFFGRLAFLSYFFVVLILKIKKKYFFLMKFTHQYQLLWHIFFPDFWFDV